MRTLIVLLSLLFIAGAFAQKGWYPHEGSVLKYRFCQWMFTALLGRCRQGQEAILIAIKRNNLACWAGGSARN